MDGFDRNLTHSLFELRSILPTRTLSQEMLRIGIIGAGKVGGSLGKLWVRAAHEVFFSSRHPNRLRLARELEAPGRLYRASLVGIVEARRPLKEIADSAQNGLLVSRVSDQPAFAATPSSSFVFPREETKVKAGSLTYGH
jgi:NADP oxidoreductase coenzyme F420-dependent